MEHQRQPRIEPADVRADPRRGCTGQAPAQGASEDAPEEAAGGDAPEEAAEGMHQRRLQAAEAPAEVILLDCSSRGLQQQKDRSTCSILARGYDDSGGSATRVPEETIETGGGVQHSATTKHGHPSRDEAITAPASTPAPRRSSVGRRFILAERSSGLCDRLCATRRGSEGRVRVRRAGATPATSFRQSQRRSQRRRDASCR